MKPSRRPSACPSTRGGSCRGPYRVSSDGSGRADLRIPIEGPEGRASVRVVAARTGGQWDYHVLTVTFESTGATLDLIAPEEAPTPEAPETPGEPPSGGLEEARAPSSCALQA